MRVFPTAARLAVPLLHRRSSILSSRNAFPLMLTNNLVLKHGLGQRPFTVSAPTNDTAPSNKAMLHIEEKISQDESEASKLRQEMLMLKPKLGGGTDTEKGKLWKYLLVTTRLESLRYTREEMEGDIKMKLAEIKGQWSEGVDDDSTDAVVKDYGKKEDDVGNNTQSANNNHQTDEEIQTNYKPHDTHTHLAQQNQKALSAVKDGGNILNRAHREFYYWRYDNNLNTQIPEEFRQRMEQHLEALATDMMHMTPRVVKEVEGRLDA